MNRDKTEDKTTKKTALVRLAALIGVIVIAGLIVAAVVVAVVNVENSGKIVIGLLSISFFLGVMIYLAGIFSKLRKRKEEDGK